MSAPQLAVCPPPFDVARLVEQLFPDDSPLRSGRHQALLAAKLMRANMRTRSLDVDVICPGLGFGYRIARLIAIDIVSRLEATSARHFCIVGTGTRFSKKALELVHHFLHAIPTDQCRHRFPVQSTDLVRIVDETGKLCGGVNSLPYAYVQRRVAGGGSVGEVLYEFDVSRGNYNNDDGDDSAWTACVENKLGPCDVQQVRFRRVERSASSDRSFQWDDTESTHSSSSDDAPIESAPTPDDEQNE